MRRSRLLPFALAALVLLPILPAPAAAQDADQHHLNMNQTVVLPGQHAGYSVSGRTGEVELRVHRILDPLAIRDLAQAHTLAKEKALERTLRIDANSNWNRDPWGGASGTVTFEKPGLYLLETQRGSTTQRAWLQVATHSYLVKQGPEKAILYAFRLQDGEPLAGARVVVNGTEAGRTGTDGILALDPDALEGPTATVAADGTVALGVLGLEAHWPGEGVRIVTQFDRPIYRPGQTVHLKVITFEKEGDRMVPFNASAVRVRATTWSRGGEEIVHESTLASNDHGSVAVSFAIPDDAPLGHYSVAITTQEGAQTWAGFQVEAYKKPRFQVDAGASRTGYVSGEDVVVRAEATWLFGSPLRRGEVGWHVRGYPDHSWGWGCWSCRYAMEWDGYGPRGGEYDLSGNGQLQPDGTFLFTFRAPEAKYPMRLEAVVTVTAENGEQQDGVVVIGVDPAAYRVELATDSWAYQRGMPVRAIATVKHLSGAPAAGVPVAFTLDQERGDATRALTATSDGTGRATVTFDAPSGGGHRLVATARDSAGREALAERWMWIADHDVGWHGSEGLALLPEKEDHRIGETMRVLVLTPRPATVLVTLEGSDLHAWQVVRVNGGRFVEFPATAAMAPGVSLVATTVSMTSEDQYGPQTQNNEVYLHVGPDPRALNVTLVPERGAYRDGDEARVLVQVRDAEGRPVQGEMSLAIVDEAIHQLREEPYHAFVASLYPGERHVRTTFAWWSLRDAEWLTLRTFNEGGAVAARSVNFSAVQDNADSGAPAPLLADGKAIDAYGTRAAATVRVREDFPDTALWLPFLRTDETGTARVRLTAPDTLTEWRVSARAHTLDGLVGDARASFLTRKPLMVELTAPRFLVQGDALNVSAVVFNHLGEMRDVEVQLLGVGAVQLAGSGYRRVTLSDGDSVRIDFPIRATDDASALANLTVVVLSAGQAGNESDAMRLRLPVLPHGVLQKAVRAGADDATISLPVPPGPYAAPPSVTVTLAPSMAATVLDALPYLLGYPYGCVEQTMSRFMPAVVATSALRGAGYDANDPKLPEYVEAGLKRLQRFQHEDGGWGWWEYDQTHPYMTAYVVAGLSEAKRAGVKVDEKMLERGVDALETLYVSGHEPDMRAYQAYALALAGSPPAAWPGEDALSLDGLALLGLAKLHAGDRAGAKLILDRLMEKAVRTEGRLHWQSEGDRWGSHGIRSDVQLTSHALRLMTGLGEDKDAPLVVSWLAGKRSGSYWATTKDTSESVLAIVDHLRGTKELTPDHDAVVKIGGETHRVPFHGDARSLKPHAITVPVNASLLGGSVAIEITREGQGRLYWSAVLAATPRVDAIPALDKGFALTKRVLDKDGKDATLLRFNEEYVVEVTVRNAQERSHVLLHDPLPAGVEVVKDSAKNGGGYDRRVYDLVCWGCGGWGGHWSNVETRDDHVAAFATTLPPGESTLRYSVRAVHPGSYHVLPATVEEMYAPDVQGRSADLHLRIGDVPRLLLGDALVMDTGLQIRVFPAGGATLRAEGIVVDVVDEEGAILPLAQPPQVVLLEDGSANVTLVTELPLPQNFTLRLGNVKEEPTVRTFRLGGEPVRFDGAFPAELASAWASGAVVDATTASTRSEPAADFGDVIRREGPPGPAQPPVDGRPSNERLPTSPIPGFDAIMAVAAVALLAVAAGRRRR